MLAHAFAWSKTIENRGKSTKNFDFLHAHDRRMRGSRSKSQKKFVGQRLRVTPKSWLTPKSCSYVQEALVGNSWPTDKIPRSNQLLGANQLLGVTPIRWPTNFFLRFATWASHEPFMPMMKKVVFCSFSYVFDRFRPCERLRKHAFAGQNTQQAWSKISVKPWDLKGRRFKSRHPQF